MCVHTRPSVSRPHTHLQRADTFTTGQLSRPQEVLHQCMNDGEREVEIEVFLPTETRLFFFSKFCLFLAVFLVVSQTVVPPHTVLLMFLALIYFRNLQQCT